MLKFKSGRLTDLQYQPYYKDLGIEDHSKQQQTLVGKILLAKLLELPEKTFLSGDAIAEGEHGKPYFKDRDEHFNISHSGNLVTVAVSDQPIGIDIEEIKPKQLDKLSHAFNVGELAYLNKLKDPRKSEQILRLWTIKEAVLKELGLGLVSKPKSIEIALPRMDYATRDGVKFKIDFLGIDHQYIGTMATKVK
ncbi:4'-phosphopantetheinyl transferase family protein [Fructilactobacillus sp. Tb1]|uniref:4'-phosphopantetheinyl transferase family protein n=1 Tax=Fructilactobacillus sp. Tb1 TaxID=3422304 RepID=UPI003D2A4581